MKIYTGGGDRGSASLFSGERLPKSDIRIEAYGDVDELNSVMGVLVAALPEKASALTKDLQNIQSDLLHIGAWLSTSPESPFISELREISEKDIKALEQAIDHMDKALPTLRGFILPGGHVCAALAHVARTVCRRAERHVVRLFAESFKDGTPPPQQAVLVYLNRLSDYLFVLARICNQTLGVPEISWTK